MALPVAVPLPCGPILRLRLRHTTTARAATARDQGAEPLPDELQLVADVRSPYNHIRVADVSLRAAGHPLAGARLLLLDGPGNIHSLYFPRRPHCPLTATYFDAFATLPPLLPRPSLAVLGFGAGSAARALLHFFPDLSVDGWELDPAVLAVARDFFGLAELEKDHAARLFVHVGDALDTGAPPGGFGGALVDLFANGSVIPQLQEADTWRRLGGMVARGGRMMVNCGGGCVEAEEEGRDGEAVKDATLRAMAVAFGEGMVSVMDVDESFVAMTGPPVTAPEEVAVWKARLPPELRHFVDMWRPYNGKSDHIAFGMGFQRKILGKRTIQASEAEVPQMTELRSLKLKRSREDDGEEALRQHSPTVTGAGAQGPLHCPPAPKKPKFVLGCSLDGFKVLSVMDLRCFLR
ncbi:hypothetical protein EJB05_21827, partial [Eragrostis curvula]